MASKAAALVAVLSMSATVGSADASAQVYPGDGFKETPKERAAYQTLIDKSGPDCRGLQDRLYGRRYRCIARFGPAAKAARDYAEAACSNIDIRMRACGVPVPSRPKGLTAAELREQERARRSEGPKR